MCRCVSGACVVSCREQVLLPRCVERQGKSIHASLRLTKSSREARAGTRKDYAGLRFSRRSREPLSLVNLKDTDCSLKTLRLSALVISKHAEHLS